MKTISVDLLEKGMVINQDIYDINGILIISDGTVLKESHVEYLKYESGILPTSGLFIHTVLHKLSISIKLMIQACNAKSSIASSLKTVSTN